MNFAQNRRSGFSAESRTLQFAGEMRRSAETVSKHPFIVAADVSRLTFTGFCMRLERTHVRYYKF